LPDDLALRYADRSARSDFVDGLKAAQRDSVELDWWTRFGRAVSFHEFELVFGDLPSHVSAGGYDSVMWPARPLHPFELPLARDLSRQRPDLGPVWSRAWLDLVLTPEPRPSPARLMRPWVMDTRGGSDVAYTRWDNVEMSSDRARLQVEPEAPTSRVIVGFVTAPGEAVLEIAAGDGGQASIPSDVAAAQRVRYVEVVWDGPSDVFELKLSVPGYVVLVCYEA
jgi:hypothetical protein